MEPISAVIYDGKDYQTFFISDYRNSDQMLLDSIKYLMLDKYNNYHIYLQNFSKFDGIFLLKIIASISDNIKTLIRDNNLITISLKFYSLKTNMDSKNKHKCIIHFHDSLLLLPSSLAKLSCNFGVESKGSFDFNLLNDAKTKEQLNIIKDDLLK